MNFCSLQKLRYSCVAFAALAFMLNSCQQDDDPAAGFALSTGNTITVASLSGADTTLMVVVTSPVAWIVESKPDWVLLSPEASDGSPMLIKTTILKNEGIDVRQGNIVFKLNNGATYSALCTQFPRDGGLVIRDHITNNLNHEAQIFGANVFTNLKNLTTEIIPSTASSWMGVAMISHSQSYEYTCEVEVKTVNNTGEARSAKVVIHGDTNDAHLTDTIYVNQMYLVEILAGSLTNDAIAFKIDWTPSDNGLIAYYEIEITDGAVTPTLLATYNVTGKSTALIDTMSFVKNTTYFGPLSITVSGKSSASATTILGQTATLRAHSHFGNTSGEGTLLNPCEISCPRHFNNIMALFDVYGRNGAVKVMELNFKQTVDITFPDPTHGNNLGGNLSIVGSKADPFLGSYDGDNFKFENVSIISDAAYVGIFGQLGEAGATSSATVKNMHVYINYIEGRASTWGASTNAAAIGGIVGLNVGNIEDCTVRKYGSDGAVYGNNRNTAGAGANNASYMGQTGGIAGGNERNILRCKNIDCPVVSRYVAGGIGGGITVPPAVTNNVISYMQYCYNLADVYQGNPGPSVTLPKGIIIEPETGAYPAEYGASGIMGNAIAQGGNYRHIIEYCFNGGHVYSENMASGIVGRVHFSNISKCFNYGTITVVRNTTDPAHTKIVAGLEGFLNNNQNIISICYNVGRLEYVDAVGTGAGITVGGCIGNKPNTSANSVVNNLICVSQQITISGSPVSVNLLGTGNSGGIEPADCYVLSDADMKELSKYTSAFSATDWVIKPGYDYPQLMANPIP